MSELKLETKPTGPSPFAGSDKQAGGFGHATIAGDSDGASIGAHFLGGSHNPLLWTSLFEGMFDGDPTPPVGPGKNPGVNKQATGGPVPAPTPTATPTPAIPIPGATPTPAVPPTPGPTPTAGSPTPAVPPPQKTPEEQIAEAVKKSEDNVTKHGFFDSVTKEEGVAAMNALKSLPPELQGKAIEKMSPETFRTMLDKVPESQREQFKTLVDNTQDPERKLQLFAEYHKSKAGNDAAKDKEKTKDEGHWYSRSDEQKENQKKNETRDDIVKNTKDEIDAEIPFLLEKAKSGKLSAAEIQKYMDNKDSEHTGEMKTLENHIGTMEGLSDEDRVKYTKNRVEQKLESGLFNPVTDEEAQIALKTAKTLPPNLQGKLIENLDKGAFERFVDNVPAADQTQFDTLVTNTHDPERKLKLWAEYHKAKVKGDADKEKEKTKDEGHWYSRSDEQKENKRLNDRRDEIVKETKSEVADETDFLLEKQKAGSLSEADVDSLIKRKDHEHDIEMKYNVNLTNKRGTRKYNTNPGFAQGTKIAWSDGELGQLESGLARMPIDHVRGNKALVKVERSDIDPDDETALKADPTYAPQYGGDHLNNVIRIQDLGVNGTYRHTGDTRDLANPNLAGLGGPTISPVEETIVHEFGHDIHDQNGDIFSRFKTAGGWNNGAHDPGRIPELGKVPAAYPTPSASTNDTWSYARTKPGEHFAETYMKAVLKPEGLAHDLLDAPAAFTKEKKTTRDNAKQGLDMLNSKNPPPTEAQKKAAEDRLKIAEEEFQAAVDDQAGQKEQFRIMREDVFHGDKSTNDAVERLRAKGVAPEKLLEFQQKAGRAFSPDQIAQIEKGYNP